MGTELRFLRQMGIDGFENSIDAEYWHGKALEISVKFLPGDSPLTKHIVSSYSKHHSPSYEQIPEDKEISSDLRVVKPFKGLDSNKLSPIIKSINSPSVKLSPLDLAPNDYFTHFNEKSDSLNPKASNLSSKDLSKESNKNIKALAESKLKTGDGLAENCKELSSSTSSSCLVRQPHTNHQTDSHSNSKPPGSSLVSDPAVQIFTAESNDRTIKIEENLV